MQVRVAEDDGKVFDIVDPSLEQNFGEDSMFKVVNLAINMIDIVAAVRPNMGQVVRTLVEAIKLELISEGVSRDQFYDAPDSVPDSGVLEISLYSLPSSDLPDNDVLPR
jgi:hypothetical protein